MSNLTKSAGENELFVGIQKDFFSNELLELRETLIM